MIRALGSSPTIQRSRFHDNTKALYFSGGSTSPVDTVIIINNGWGISIEGAEPIIHNSILHDNTNYDIENLGTETIDAWSNYWGLNTYAEMIAGPFPQNITSIFDKEDDPTKGQVDYSNWIAPFNNAPQITSASSITATEDTYFIYRATGTDAEDSTLTWVFDLEPGWLSSDADSIFGTPTDTATDTSFRVIASDGDKADTLVVTLTMVPVNDPPVINVAAGITVTEDGTVVVTQSELQATDPDDPPSQLLFTLQLPATPFSGLFLVNNIERTSFTQAEIDSGWLSFKHDGSENLLDSLGFTVTDTSGLADAIEAFYITVLPVNDLPQITSTDSLVLEEGSQFVYQASHLDPDGPEALWTFTDFPAWMTWVTGADRLLLAPINGSVDSSFVLIVSDSLAADTLVVFVTVIPFNDPPLAVDDSVSTDEDVPVNIAVLANDSDIDDDHSTLVISGIDSSPLHGTVTILGDTALYYIPQAEFSGFDSLSYIVSDSTKSDTAKVFISVIYVNDPPVITSSADTLVLEESTVSLYFATHTDPDGPDTVWTFSDYPGWMTWNPGADSLIMTTGGNTADSSFKVQVSDGENTASFTVTVVVIPWNDPPVALNDAVQTLEDATVVIAVLVNDSDVDSEFLTVDSLLVLPSHGMAVIDTGDTSITYTPASDYNGSDSLSYILSDGIKFDTATVYITIDPVNDRPAIISLASVSMTEGSEWTYQALVDDIDGPDTLWTFSDFPAWLTWIGGSSALTGTPGNGDTDTSFTVMVSDGFLGDTLIVAVSVTPVNDAPQIPSPATLLATEDERIVYRATATDPEDDPLTFQYTGLPTWLIADADSVFGTPANGAADTSFRVIASDGSLADTLTVTVSVTPVNDAPQITSPATLLATEDERIVYRATATDPDGPALTWIFNRLPGGLSAAEDTVFGIPSEGDADSSFQVIAWDSLAYDTLRVELQVTPVNDRPRFSATLPDAGFAEDDSVRILFSSWYANVADPDNADSELLWTFANEDSVTVRVDSTGVTFRAPPNWHGIDTLSVIVSDLSQLSDTSSVVLTVVSVNDAPGEFASMSPGADSTLVIADGNVSDSLVFHWGPAADVDGDPVWYGMTVSGGLALILPLDTATVFPSRTYRFQAILDSALAAGDSVYSGGWLAYATDGTDTTWAGPDMQPFTIKISQALLALPEDRGLPATFALQQNYPNPFNPVTTIKYELPRAAKTVLIVYNIAGQQVARLVDEELRPGYYQTMWDGRDQAGRQVASGIYILRLTTPVWSQTMKTLLLK